MYFEGKKGGSLLKFYPPILSNLVLSAVEVHAEVPHPLKLVLGEGRGPQH